MFSFYRKLLIRQLRQPSIRLFCVAIALATAVTLSISLLGDRLEQLFNMQAKEVLAADMVLSSTSQLTPEQNNIILSYSLREATTLTFQTMSSSEASENFLLSSVKAVTHDYPLLGELKIANKLYGEVYATTDTPNVGEAWVEDRVLNELGIQLNQTINIGEQSFNVTRVLVYEPDRGNSFYSFTPRILINWQDVEQTQIIQPGSRVRYRYLFAGSEPVLDSLKQELSHTLEINQQFVTVDSANQMLSDTLDRAYRFLNITALIAVLLGAVSASLVSYQYANVMTHQYALLRCLGLQSGQMAAAVIVPFLLFTLIALSIGFFLGTLAHWVIVETLAELIPESLPAASVKPYLISSLTALIIVSSFAWPFIKKVLNTPPKLLLNQVREHQGNQIYALLFILTGLSVLIYLATRDFLISIYILGILFIFVLVAYIFTRMLIRVLNRISLKQKASVKLAIRNLGANHSMVSIQVIAVALTFFALALITTIRDDLIISWQSKVPENAPNIFVINLFSQDKQKFLDTLQKYQVSHSPVYPIIRGRLSAVNNVNINEYVKHKEGRYDDALERDLALTWSNQLPDNNSIVKGVWSQSETSINSVSIERDIAANLDIKVGDSLTFTIETQTISAQVTSIRTVEWESFSPNFYMIFSHRALENLPTTYMASLRLDTQQKPLLSEFVGLFPNATFFDVEYLLQRIREITDKVSLAIETVLYFALISSILVFISIEMILRRNRMYSSAIFKAIGSTTSLTQTIFRIEFILIGILSGIIAYLLNILVSIIISNYVIDGAFVFNIKTALLCLIIAPILVFIAGYFSIYQTKQMPVKALLK